MTTQAASQSPSVKEIGTKLVELCRENKNLDVVEQYYADDIVSVEPMGPPGAPLEQRGKQAIREKHHWWFSNMEVHSQTIEGPYPNGNQFIVTYKLDLTDKTSNKRFQMSEAGLYTVEDGKIVREEFFYSM